MSQGDLTANERRTIQMFGKPYHWARSEEGTMRLVAGVAPTETDLTLSELTSLPKES